LNDAQLGQLRSSAGEAFDKLFLAYMIFHHEGAVMTSQQVLNTGAFPAVKRLASQIIETQQTEIAEMRQLLARLGGPLPTAIPSGPGQPAVPGAQGQLVATGPTTGPSGSAGAAPAQAVPGRTTSGQPATSQPATGQPATGQPTMGTPTTQPPVYVPAPSGGGGGGGGCTPEHQQQGHC
jgi:hypothetical protein